MTKEDELILEPRVQRVIDDAKKIIKALTRQCEEANSYKRLLIKQNNTLIEALRHYADPAYNHYNANHNYAESVLADLGLGDKK